MSTMCCVANKPVLYHFFAAMHAALEVTLR